jgi:cytoskeletal protein CcmA (bactofilin family)
MAVIGKNMVIIGKVTSSEDLYVDGEVRGTLEVLNSRLTIGPNGKANAGAKAREVEVMGRVDGDVESVEKISIRKGGQLVGDIRAAGIVIEDGAYFKGSIDIVPKTAGATA